MLYSDTCIQTLPSSAIRINLMLVKVPWASQVVLDVKNLSANAGGWGRTHGGRNGNLLQYSCLEHPMDRGAWPAIDHGVTKSRVRLSDWTGLNWWVSTIIYSKYRATIEGFCSLLGNESPLNKCYQDRRRGTKGSGWAISLYSQRRISVL